jgi:hypothetical protein
MSNCLYDFLSDSFLLQKEAFFSKFNGFTDAQIDLELERYLDFINIQAVREEVKGVSPLSVLVGDVELRPSIAIPLLNQAALYLDRLVLKDPVDELAIERSSYLPHITGVVERVAGPAPVPRERLALACARMLYARPLVAAGVLKFIPVGPAFLLQNYSLPWDPSVEAYTLPPSVEQVYTQNARVRPCVWTDEGAVPTDLLPSADTQTLEVEFASDGVTLSKKMSTRLHLAAGEAMSAIARDTDALSPSQLESWISQTIREHAQVSYGDLLMSANLAEQSSCALLLLSPLASKVMAASLVHEVPNPSIRLDLNLPTVEAPLDRIIDIRKNYGEAFELFRKMWKREITHLTSLDPSAMSQAHVNEVWAQLVSRADEELGREWKKLRRSILAEAAILVGTIATTFVSGAILSTPLAVAAAAGAGVRKYVDYINGIRNNPFFFVSKVSRS